MRWLFLQISILFFLTAAAVAPNAAETAKVRSAKSASKAQKSAAEMRKFADERYKQCLSR